MIREYVTINPGTEGGGFKTIIGNNCLFMISSRTHDCKIGNNVIIANNVPLGGHAKAIETQSLSEETLQYNNLQE